MWVLKLGAAPTSSGDWANWGEFLLDAFTRDVEDSDPLRVLCGAASAAQLLRSIASIQRAITGEWRLRRRQWLT